jgi:hypothetical protein
VQAYVGDAYLQGGVVLGQASVEVHHAGIQQRAGPHGPQHLGGAGLGGRRTTSRSSSAKRSASSRKANKERIDGITGD